MEDCILNGNAELLAENLEILRTTAGWSLSDLGTIVGLNKQTIRNLELKNNSISRLEYYALLEVFKEESKVNEKLEAILKLIFDGKNFSREEKAKALIFAKGAAKTSIDSSLFATCLGTLLGITVATIPALIKRLTNK